MEIRGGRLLPRGALVRSTNRNINSILQFDNASWRSGRSVKSEEERSGMLTTSFSLQGGPKFSFSAVQRCQSSDWQVNEINVNDVEVVSSQPKGRWRKVDRHESAMVEDDSNESFLDPEKSFTPRMVHGGRYAPVIGKLPARTPVLSFSMFRQENSIAHVLERLRYATQLSSEAIHLAGDDDNSGCATDDSFGCVVQKGRVLGMTREYLPHASKHYGLRPLIFEPREYLNLSDFSNDSASGALFRIVLRCSSLTQDTIKEWMPFLEHNGFLNYYPIGCFSIGSNTRHDIGAVAGSRNYFKACSLHLQSQAEANPILFDTYARYVSADKSTIAATVREMSEIAQQHRFHHTLVLFLQGLSEVSDFSEDSKQLQNLWERFVPQKKKYLNAVIGFLWNAAASQRMISGGNRPRVGDLVYISEAEYVGLSPDRQERWQRASIEGIFASKTTPFYVSHILNDSDVHNTTIARVVLPVVDGQSDSLFPNFGPTLSFHEDFSKLHSFSWLFTDSVRVDQMRKNIRRLSVPTYRTLLAYPSSGKGMSMPDPSSLATLKDDRFVLQERMPVLCDVDRNIIRTPSVSNVSPRFVNDMLPIIREHGTINSQQSTVLSMKLPRGSHISSLLREHCPTILGQHIDLIG